jgi:predicted nucleic acid-binding protein
MKVFLDANGLLDLFDDARPLSLYSTKVYTFLLSSSDVELFTSCDLITTIYYLNSKIDKQSALSNIIAINKTLKVVEFSNKEIDETCSLMTQDSDYKDLEDTIQYVLAKKYECDYIISNDKKFVSKDIILLTSQEFSKQHKV